MARWENTGRSEERLAIAGDAQFLGLDMKTPDPTAIKPGYYPEAYNVRSENGGLEGRLGSIAPGYFNFVSYGQIYGEGLYSDPSGLEWEVIGVSSGAWFIADGVFPRFIPYDFICSYPVEFVQAFDVLFIFRGANLPELVWHGDWNIFWQDLPPPSEVTEITGQWNWITTGSPGNGQITTDTGNWNASATKVDVSKISNAGTDVSSLLLGTLKVGDVIRMATPGNADNQWVLWNIAAVGIDQGTYIRYVVTWNSAGTIAAPGQDTVLDVTFAAIDTTRVTIPPADTAEYYANRLLVPYGKDRIAVSDILEYSRYDELLDDFQVNTGQADGLVRIFPWINSMVIVFKSHSIFKISNVFGDLSQTSLAQISSSRGLCSRRAAVDIGGDILFMDYSGVYAISQVLVNTPQVQALPLSDPIKPIINGINWTYGAGIVAAARRERVYFAVPLRNASRNNALIIYNMILGAWESIDTFDDPEFRIDRLIRMNYNGERRLFAVDMMQGLIVLLEQGKTDILGPTTAHERQIQAAVLSRGYAGPGPRNRFERLELDLSSWNPSFTAEAYVDGSDVKALSKTETADRTKYEVWNKPAWNSENLGDDHAAEFRQDYSVQLPVMLGYNGIQIERLQEKTYRYTVRMKGRYLQVRVQSSQGHLGIRTIMTESYEDQRAVRAMVSG